MDTGRVAGVGYKANGGMKPHFAKWAGIFALALIAAAFLVGDPSVRVGFALLAVLAWLPLMLCISFTKVQTDPLSHRALLRSRGERVEGLDRVKKCARR